MENFSSGLSPASAVNVPMRLLFSMDRQWNKARAELSRFQQEGTPESVRSLRVALRRLRVLLQLLHWLRPYKRLPALARDYKDQLNSLDDLRDVQVMLERTAAAQEQVPSIQPFREYLEGRYRKAMKAARQRAKKLDMGETLIALVRWMERLDGQEMEDISARLAQAVDEAFLLAQKRLALVEAGDPASIHRLRLAFKSFRYRVETVLDLLPAPPDLPERLKAYQGRMGEVQDLLVLSQRLADFSAEAADFDLAPAQAHFQRQLDEAIQAFMKEKDTLSDLWRPAEGQPFPWEKNT